MLKAISITACCASMLLASIAAEAHSPLPLPIMHFKTHAIKLPVVHPTAVAPTTVHEQLIESLAREPANHTLAPNHFGSLRSVITDFESKNKLALESLESANHEPRNHLEYLRQLQHGYRTSVNLESTLVKQLGNQLKGIVIKQP